MFKRMFLVTVTEISFFVTVFSSNSHSVTQTGIFFYAYTYAGILPSYPDTKILKFY